MTRGRGFVYAGSPLGLLRLVGWRGIVALAALVSLAVVLFLVAGALFLVVFPAALLAGLIARWIAGRGARPVGGDDLTLIEGRYEVVELEPREPSRRP